MERKRADDKGQAERFNAAARELGCDEVRGTLCRDGEEDRQGPAATQGG